MADRKHIKLEKDAAPSQEWLSGCGVLVLRNSSNKRNYNWVTLTDYVLH